MVSFGSAGVGGAAGWNVVDFKRGGVFLSFTDSFDGRGVSACYLDSERGFPEPKGGGAVKGTAFCDGR